MRLTPSIRLNSHCQQLLSLPPARDANQGCTRQQAGMQAEMLTHTRDAGRNRMQARMGGRQEQDEGRAADLHHTFLREER